MAAAKSESSTPIVAPPVTPPPAQPIARVLAEVSKAVGVVRKASTAPSNIGGFNFRGVDAVVNAAHPVLADYGVVVIPEVLEVTMRTYATSNNREMADVTVRTRFTFHGPAGDSVSAVVLGEGSDVGDKATGKAQSVALRTALLQVLMLPTDEPDPDESNGERIREGAPQRQERRQRDDPDQGSQEPIRPAHLKPWDDAFQALSPEQREWVKTHWPLDRPPARMTVADTARAVEWLAANVPPF